MKLYILLFIMVTKATSQAVAGHNKNLAAENVDGNARTLQFGEKLSGRKEQIDTSRKNTKEAHGDSTKGEEIRSKRGHTQRINTSHFVIGGHTSSITGSHNQHIGNTHGVVIPVLGVSSGQTSLRPFINYGSATLTRSGPGRHPSGSTSVKHFSHGHNHHKAGIKEPETIKRLISNGGYSTTSLSNMKTVDSDVLRNLLGHGYHKHGPYSQSDGYSPGTGYYYGK